MSMSAAVGAPAPVRIAGKEYTASPIDFDGLGELEEYARAFILAVATKAAEDLPPAAAEQVIDRALEKATSVRFDSRKFNEYLTSERGMVAVLSIALRPRHASLTRAAVGAMVKGRSEELVAAVDVVLRISGFGGDEKKDGQKKGEAGQGGAAA